MTDPLLWILITVQVAFGAADTLFHHEMTERLAWRPSQKNELRLHGVRNFFYAAIFLLIGWTEPKGAIATALLIVLAIEIIITLWDFVEEDRSRRLPATERVLHTLLALNYGAILVLAAPVLWGWSKEPTALPFAHYGFYSWLCIFGAVGTVVFGVRDILAAQRTMRIISPAAAPMVAQLKGRKNILITGGTGFVGVRLAQALIAGGHNVTVLTRRPDRAMDVLPAPIRLISSLDHIAKSDTIDAIAHLAGEPIANGLWTKAKKRRVVESRVTLTESLIRLATRLEQRPECFIAASAIGWYGVRGPEPLMETNAPVRDNFSHESCEAVEAAAREMEIQGVRTIRLRIGLVLDPAGGLLARMLTPFEFGLGGPFGEGKQMMSWITRDDLVRLIGHIIATPKLTGAVNAAAPGAVTNETFTTALAAALNRPAIFRVPAAPLRFALGQFADELLLGGQNVKPDKAQASGFLFADPALEPALQRMLGAQSKSRKQFLPLSGGALTIKS